MMNGLSRNAADPAGRIPARVSVIMPCFKMGKFIGEALASVGSQSDADWEVVAVDDCGPEDGSRAAVERLAREFPQHRIEWIRHERNRGVSAARNTAMASARGELLAFLDPDDFWHPHYLSEQAKVFAGSRKIDLAYTGVHFIDQTGTVTGSFEPSEKFVKDFPQKLFCKNEIHLSTVVVRAAAVSGAGGFDESPEIQHVEDWDLWIRLALAGATFERTKAPPVYYRRHVESASFEFSKMWARSLNLMKKHRGEFRVVEALYEKCHELEAEMEQLQRRHDGLESVYQHTLDRRSKNWLRKLVGRNHTV